MSGEAEPRRSVRATKGQHTKSFDELEQLAPKRRQGRKSKKAQEQEQEQGQGQDQDQDQDQDGEPEEVIRCVCGATEQDEDSGEAWISCETCYVWQHNVCVGVSSFDDEIPDKYYCEKCRPQDHKELLEGMARGEKPWEARRKEHEEESDKKRRRGGRKGKGKRNSDPKEEIERGAKAKPSPGPEAGGKEKREPPTKQGKRKLREDSNDGDRKTPKLRRVSDGGALPVHVDYTPPDDLPATIQDLPSARIGPAKALKKSLVHVMTKDAELDVPEDSSVDVLAEATALQVERAVFDAHPTAKGPKEYGQQIKSLTFNLKNNPELYNGLVEGVNSPNTLAIMTSDQMASAELQRQTAEMRARAEKQSILYTSDTGPRVRRTHKGEEVVEDEALVNSEAPPPLPGGSRRAAGRDQAIKRESVGHDQVELPARSPSQHGDAHGDPQHSPSNPNFDITKVFSSVRSPTLAQHRRRPSAPVAYPNGPGVDADVDRMLQEDNDSPPYSPTEESHDADVVWRGALAMSSIADFQATAKHVGGANFASIGPWSKLIPKRMAVAGRITQQSAIEYLCSLRYSNLTDIVVVNVTPVSPDAQPEFNALIDYFIGKKRYGVIGDKVAGNVRDTYLVPVPPGEDNQPEFMLNLVDNSIPRVRTEPMLLAVFVYRNDVEQARLAGDTASPAQAVNPAAGTPTPPPYAQRSNSLSGPSYSPSTPHAPPQNFNGRVQSTTPVPIPQPPGARPASASAAAQSPPAGSPTSDAQKLQAQQEGQRMAMEVLGPWVEAPTVRFLLPQAFQMSRREWEVIRAIYEREPRAQDDLQFLGALLEKEGDKKPDGSAARAS